MMKIIQFGRPMCGACAEARENIASIRPPYFSYTYHQVTGDVLVDGPAACAESDFYDVFDVLPVVIIERGGVIMRRWDGVAPSVLDIKEELR